RPLHASTRYCSAAGNGALLSLSKNRIHSQEALALPRAENFAPSPHAPTSSLYAPEPVYQAQRGTPRSFFIQKNEMSPQNSPPHPHKKTLPPPPPPLCVQS